MLILLLLLLAITLLFVGDKKVVSCYTTHNLFLLLVALTSSQSAQSAEPAVFACTPVALLPTDSVTGLTVTSIQVRTGDLFDRQLPSENRLVHGAANALHIATRESTVRQALPFRLGAVLESDSLTEAERILRSRRYLRSATVAPLRRCGDGVEIEVRTVDNWTLTPSVSVSSKGGVERYKVEVQDLNVLGLGKELAFKQSESSDEQESSFVYGDDNVFGTHHRFRLELGSSDTGDSYTINTGLPFVFSNTPRAWWIHASESRDSLSLSLVQQSNDTDGSSEASASEGQAHVDEARYEIGVAKRLDNSNADIARLGMGFRYQKQKTFDTNNSPLNDITDFKEQYPYFFAQWAKSSWSEQRNFLGLGKIEDIDTGLGVRVEAGFLLDAFGNDNNALRTSTTLSKGFWTSDSSVHRLALNQTQYFGRDGNDRSQIGARYHYFNWITEKNHLDIHLVADQLRGQSAINDIELGGEFGLKGYRNGIQQGDTRVLAIAEFRHVSDWSPFSLVNFGWGVFAEAGRAWDERSPDNTETLVDIGAGFLFSPSRSSRNEIARIDITFPLVDGEGVDQYLLFVGTQLKFR